MAIPPKRIPLVEENGVRGHLLTQLLNCLGYAVTDTSKGIESMDKNGTRQNPAYDSKRVRPPIGRFL